VIQFRDAVDNGDGTFTLSHLLRGRRGSDWACGLHAAGDLFALLEPDGAWQTMALPLADLGQARHARLAGRFDTFDALPMLGRTPAGEAEKPYSPVRVTGSRDGSGNLAITWIRRTRIGGEWRDSTESPPLAEQAEAYEVEVLDGGGAVVRTLAGVTAPSAAYSAAEQTADFGALQAAVSVRVHQISATVGRGRPRAATV
jgi:hypothetical protein